MVIKWDLNNTPNKFWTSYCREVCDEGSLDPKKLTGKIVICLRGGISRVSKGYVVSKAGAVGMILVNDKESGDGIITDLHMLPASHVSYKDSITIFQYINSTKYCPMFPYHFLRLFINILFLLQVLKHINMYFDQDTISLHQFCDDRTRNQTITSNGWFLIKRPQ